MDSTVEPLRSFILNPANADYLAILKGARNGAVYGAKVRFPHALVMVFLFRSGTFREKLRLIFKATRQHARNLATFATIYKTSMLALRRLSPSQKESSSHTFLSGLLGGYMVFGRGRSGQSSVNKQIVMYVFARVVFALATLAVQTRRSQAGYGSRRFEGVRDGVVEGVKKNSWPVFAAMSWGLVMWLFRWHPDTVQPSMRSSMKYIYVDSDRWDGLRNFLIHNK